MASYVRSWLSSQLPILSTMETPQITESPPIEDDDDADTVKGEDDDDDMPPAFPALNSAQRMTSGPTVTVPRILTDSDLMPPPPLPSLVSRRPGVPSSSSSLAVPTSLAVPPATTKPPKKVSRKVALAPGHGPLDWANLKKSGADLRGVDSLMRIPMSVLKQHNKRDDAWSAFNGKVYNITSYIPYHPGGEKELLRVAGRDGSKLFALTHAWVNLDYMLDACLVGFLVPDS
ncbi:hypothetical protein NLI96_g6399 [Meripilus lineatus]|uniref:Cytochrome b5 heme-binding domain-containing protein n=1 Tax=Meripilus lineatus TaxID=2056292 RepID=A0AAD5YD00_9APHY|nr:hypothetical protein NLI96_g6399 [Physisporinus lineatus]